MRFAGEAFSVIVPSKESDYMSFLIDRSDPGRQFIEDRMTALNYLDKIALKLEGGTHEYFRWIKTEPSYPAFEDFTFGFGNQIFPVLVLRANEQGRLLNVPPRIEALRRESEANSLIPCVFPILDRTGKPFFSGRWNLINPFTGKQVDPVAESSDDLVEISDWELRNWAVQIVYDSLEKDGLEKLSYCDAPGIDPQIWFRDKAGHECWLEVLYAPYPADIQSLTFSYSEWPEQVLSHEGYVARVGFADSEGMPVLCRTRGAFVNFRGIEHIYSPA